MTPKPSAMKTRRPWEHCVFKHRLSEGRTATLECRGPRPQMEGNPARPISDSSWPLSGVPSSGLGQTPEQGSGEKSDVSRCRGFGEVSGFCAQPWGRGVLVLRTHFEQNRWETGGWRSEGPSVAEAFPVPCSSECWHARSHPLACRVLSPNTPQTDSACL